MRSFTQFNFMISNWTHKSCFVVLLYCFFVTSVCEIRLGTLQDIWSLISTTFTFLPALQWIDKVVIVALSPVHADDRPRDICNQQNPQKFGIQVGSRDRCRESGSNTASLWFKSFGSAAAGCFTCHAQSDVLACHRGCFYGSLLNKHTVCSLWVVSHSSAAPSQIIHPVQRMWCFLNFWLLKDFHLCLPVPAQSAQSSIRAQWRPLSFSPVIAISISFFYLR